LTESNGSERKALKQMMQAGITYVADRGYFAYYLMLELAAAGAFFVLRAPCSVTYKILENLPVTLPGGVSWLLNVQDLKVHCEKGEDGQTSGTWRVVRFTLGESEFILFTNRWDLTTWQIITIYAYRWQIELLFLFIKRTINGLHLLTHDKDGLEIQFHLMLVSALLLLHFKQLNEQAVGKKPGKVEPMPLPAGKEVDKAEKEQTHPPVEKPVEVVEVLGIASVAEGQTEPETQGRQTESERSPTTPEPTAGFGINPEPTAGVAIELEPKVNSAERQGIQPPVREPQQSKKRENTSKPTGGQPPCRQGTVQPGENSTWYGSLGKELRTFWRISVHWLHVLRQHLARVWNPAVFQNLPGSTSFRQKRDKKSDCQPQIQASQCPELTSRLSASLAGNLSF